MSDFLSQQKFLKSVEEDNKQLQKFLNEKLSEKSPIALFAMNLGGIHLLEQMVCPKCEEIAFFSGNGKSTCTNCGNVFDNNRAWTLRTYLENELIKRR